MREYAKVSGTFWTGKTGRELKAKGPEALIVGMYLMTCPNSNMLGLYWLPKLYLSHETGLGSEGASKGLTSAIEAGFCHYDEASEMVWVVEMAAYQIADTLKQSDNRVVGIQREYDALPENPYLSTFYERYAAKFWMTSCRGKAKGLARGSKAPPKPRAGAGAGTGEKGLPPRACRLPPDWAPSAEDSAFAESVGFVNGRATLEAAKFRDYWTALSGPKALKADWPATWRNWRRNAETYAPSRKAAQNDPFAGAA